LKLDALKFDCSTIVNGKTRLQEKRDQKERKTNIYFIIA